MSQYFPITRNVKEYLEELIVLNKQCALQFRTDSQATISLQTSLLDLYTDEGIDYLMTSEGLRIALEDLVDVDGMQAHSTC